MSAAQISKQDYLKKYLSGAQDKKKKKKKKVTHNSIIKSKIIDDDIDLRDIKPVDSDELEIYDLAEEAPQVVGIVDERPEEVRLMSEYKNTKKWRIVADEYGIEDVKVTAIGGSDKTNEVKEIKKENNENTCQKLDSSLGHRSKKESESRVKVKKSDSDLKTRHEDSDYSPLRKIKKEKSDSDISPPRKSSKQYDSDNSPPRKSRKNSESLSRKIKKEKSDSDASPPRRSRKHSPVLKKGKKEKSDPDVLRERKSKRESDSDESPPRKPRTNYDSDQSPPRRSKKSNASDSDKRRRDHHSHSVPDKHSSKRRERDSTSDKRDAKKRRSKSPDDRLNHRESGKSKSSDNTSKSKIRDESHPSDDAKSKNTLSGRKSGLQNADELRKEIEEMKEREKEMKLNVSGKNEAVVVRDRKTGMRIDPKEEARKRREKEEKEADKLAQYAVWGKGVKQVQDSQNKLKDDLYEMSKPLARYADDKDLDEMLRNKEWDGDPMLDYIRKKKKKKESLGKDSQRPEYEGSYLPNRYGIRPGHRWDGVDRSNGYEKKWFEEQNAKKAREEEAFKWSTADM